MLQMDYARDHVVGTGISHGVEQFARQALKYLAAICEPVDVPVFEERVKVGPGFCGPAKSSICARTPAWPKRISAGNRPPIFRSWFG
jgi:hypothetical protein